MKCAECGTEMRVTTENRKGYSGLDHVTIANVEVRRCPSCGEEEVVYRSVEKLDQALATMLAQKKERLLPSEVRFLRSHLGWSGAEFARKFDVSPETVSRWESKTNPKPMSAQAERLLRVLAMADRPASDYDLEHLGSAKARRTRIRLQLRDNHWRGAVGQ